MDPVTHALVGLGVGALSGQALSPYNPIYCAAILGALAPDFDVLSMLRGKVFFMRHHRGASHSLAGILIISLLVSLVIKVDFAVNPWLYLPWALAGALSHVILDCLNSYGTQLWWPFSSKRLAGNLLMFIDPLLILTFSLPLIFFRQEPRSAAQATLLAAIFYLAARGIMRTRAARFLRAKYANREEQGKLTVFPALHGIANWDFRIEERKCIKLGTLNLFRHKINNVTTLERQATTALVEKALQSGAGRFFRQFTSHYHFSHWEEKGRLFVRLLDLRFQKQRDFFYRLTFVFNEQLHLEEASFHTLQETISLETR